MSEAIQIEPFSPSEQLERAHLRLLKSRVHVSGPSSNTRASSIGNECERAIFYDQTVPAAERIPHTPQLQAIFDMGRIAEERGLRVLEDMGAEIVQRERDYLDRERRLSGHTDAKIRLPGWDKATPIELKSLNPYTGDSIKSLRDIKENHSPWVRKYHAQLQIYLHFDDADLGVFVLWNKSTWWPRFIDCPRDQPYIDQLLEKAERVKLAVLSNEPPPRHLSSDCDRCPFLHVCGPDRAFGEGVSIIDNPELEAMIARREELSAAARSFHALDNEIKEMLPEREGELLIGDYAVIRKAQHRKAYSVAATSFYKTEIKKLTK